MRIDLAKTDEALRDPWFWAYLEMMGRLLHITDVLTRWSESCPCHCPPGIWSSDFQAPSRKPQSSHASCPLAGLHAPELAAGELEPRLQQLFGTSHSALLLCPHVLRLSAAQKARVLQDFSTGRRFMLCHLSMKTSHWQQLPWSLLSLGHYDNSKAQAGARRSLQLWDSQVGTRAGREHWLSDTFLRPGSPGRTEMENFVGSTGPGGPRLSDFPMLHTLAARSLFVMVVERYIEGRHSISMRMLRNAPHGTATHLPYMLVSAQLQKIMEGTSCEDTCRDA